MGDAETDDLGLSGLLQTGAVATDGAERVRALGDQRRRRGAQARAVIGVLLVVVVLAGLAVAARRDGTTSLDSVGPTGSSTPGTSVPHGVDDGAATPDGAAASTSTTRLFDFGQTLQLAELPTRTVPDGWQTIDHGDLRFSVPSDWELLTSITSPCVGAGSVVLMKRMDDMTNCPMGVRPTPEPSGGQASGITPFVEVRSGVLADATVPTKLGDLDAMQGPPIPRPCCINILAQIDQWVVSIQGGADADASAIADTFTWSARYRARYQGPLLDTSGWRTITEQGVQFEVPADWPTVELTGSTRTNPGACIGRPFGPSDERQVFVGTSAMHLDCATASPTVSPPTDGVWVRGMAGDNALADPAPPLEHREQHGLSFDLNPTIAVSQVILVVADVGTAPGRDQPRTSLVIGAGADPAIARTILATLRPAPS